MKKKFIFLALLFLIQIPLLSMEQINSNLIKAVQNNDLETVKELISAGADVNIQNNNGFTLLAITICKDNGAEIAKELIKAGININDEHLHFAAHYNRLEIVKELIKYDANLVQSNYGQSALSLATRFHRNIEMARELIKAGTNLSIQNQETGNAFLHSYVNQIWIGNNTEIVKSILEESLFLPQNNKIPTLFTLCTCYITNYTITKKNSPLALANTIDLAILPQDTWEKFLETVVYHIPIQKQIELADNNKNISDMLLTLNLKRHLMLLQGLCNLKNNKDKTAYDIALFLAQHYTNNTRLSEAATMLKTVEDAQCFIHLPEQMQKAITRNFAQRLKLDLEPNTENQQQ